MSKPTFSFAVTAYNEMAPERHNGGNLVGCLKAATFHPGIREIVIVDDGSDVPISNDRLYKVFRNPSNLGVFLNKLEAVARSTSDWVVCCDSDNIKDEAHIDKALSLPLDADVFYCPSFARPKFDYRAMIGEYDLGSIGELLNKPCHISCCLNTGNQIIHRQTFMDVFGKYRHTDYWLDMWRHLNVPVAERASRKWRMVWDANDSLLYNMLWLYAGKRLAIVDGLEYDHYWTSGPESNYIRSPEEKSTLNVALLKELTERSNACRGK